MSGQQLQRTVGIPGAVALGLGSMLGSGIFIGVGIAAGVTGPSVLLAIAAAAVLALCNGLSSAQLAASHPVAGGTYEYGYQYLHPLAGFSAGWLFMVAKSASAATAALGCAGYLLLMLDVGMDWLVPLALALVVAVSAVVIAGLKRSALANTVIVSVTLIGLLFFIAITVPSWSIDNFSPFFSSASLEGVVEHSVEKPASHPLLALLQASALMFVAFTGYGRVATLGEEIHNPQRTIPLAVVATIACTAGLYLAVTAAALAAVGSVDLASAVGDPAVGDQVAPLAAIADRVASWGGGWVLMVAAITAMAGVLLNLVLGLSRVLMAMARRRDVPAGLARLDAAQRSPRAAVVVVALIVGGLVMLGSVRLAWSLSAVTVLVYYALTNLAALRLPSAQRRIPRVVPLLGLVGCIGLTPWLDAMALAIAAVVLAVGWLWFALARVLTR